MPKQRHAHASASAQVQRPESTLVRSYSWQTVRLISAIRQLVSLLRRTIFKFRECTVCRQLSPIVWVFAFVPSNINFSSCSLPMPAEVEKYSHNDSDQHNWNSDTNGSFRPARQTAGSRVRSRRGT